MCSEKCVYLLVGQRGAGKTTYAAKLLAAQPELSLVSRDEVLQRRFGSTDTSPYSGAQGYAVAVTHRWVRLALRRSNAQIILDIWTMGSHDRVNLIRSLREYGADRVVALYFVTQLECVNVWFWLKPGIARSSEMRARRGEGLTFFLEDAPQNDHHFFHRDAAAIDRDGFDEVIRIDPRNDLVHLG